MNDVTYSLIYLLFKASVYLLIGYIIGKAVTINKKAKIIESGIMVFEMQKGYRIIGIAFFLFAIFLLSQSNTINDLTDLFLAVILISLFLILGSMTIILSFDVVEMSSEKIRNYNKIGIGKEKVIFWEAIDNIRYDTFSRSIKIISKKTKIEIGIERSGFEDFLLFLRTRYGNNVYGVSLDDVGKDIKEFKKFPIE